jgi:hypothetical protein
MSEIVKVCKVHSGFWFSFYGQGYYFSVGYFAFTKTTEYLANFLKNLDDGQIAIKCRT